MSARERCAVPERLPGMTLAERSCGLAGRDPTYPTRQHHLTPSHL